MAELISIREFARREDCNDKLVRRAIANGFLALSEGKTLDAALVGSPWRKRNRDRADTSGSADTELAGGADSQAVSAPAAPAADAPRGDDETGEDGAAGGIPKLAESEARRAHYLALQREDEYRQRRGELIELSTAKQVLFDEFRAARDAWLAWPGNNAALIAAKLGVEPGPVLDVLTLYVRKQIDALAEPTGREFQG